MVTNYLSKQYADRSTSVDYVTTQQHQDHICHHAILSQRNRWANMHLNWDINQWGKVVFSDESKCTIKPTAQRRRVWRKQGERFKPSNLIPEFKSGFRSISVWAAFSVNGRTLLVRIEGNLNQTKYKQISKND